MDRTIFRAALRASAKVTFTAAIASCGGAVLSTPGDASPAIRGDGAPQADDAYGSLLADAADASPPPMACTPPPAASLLLYPGQPDAGVSEALFDCCMAVIGPDVPNVGIEFGEASAQDAKVLDCCAVVIDRIDSTYADLDAGAHARVALADAGLDIYSCCYALSYHGGITCAPWGPPVPPAMPDARTDVA
jgi:hypothetical protein